MVCDRRTADAYNTLVFWYMLADTGRHGGSSLTTDGQADGEEYFDEGGGGMSCNVAGCLLLWQS